MKIIYEGQNGFLIQHNGVNVSFDLYLSNCVYERTGSGKRNYPAPCGLEELEDIMYYFISHDHLDHLDVDTVQALAKAAPGMIFICPYPHMHLLKDCGVSEENIIGAKAYQHIELRNGISVSAIPQKHEEYTVIDGEHGNLGYVLTWEGYKFYHAGDAVADKKLADDLKNAGPFDVMFVPINGHDWKRFENDTMGNMTYREALDLCDYVGTEYVVPMHYDLFDNNTENPAFFVDYLYREYPGQKFKMFMPGEKMDLEKKDD